MLTRPRVLLAAAALVVAAGCSQDKVAGPGKKGTAPCTSSGTLTVGGTANGNLSAATCWFSYDSTRVQHYTLTVTQTTPVVFAMNATSGSFDPFLWLYRNTYGDTTGIIAFNNDADGSTANSALRAVLVPGTYVIAANHNDPRVFGAYSLSATSWNGSLENCEEAFVMIGTTTEQSLATTDCTNASATRYADAVAIYAGPGQSVNVTVSSTWIHTQLELDDLNLSVIDSDDNAAGSETSHVSAAGVPGGAFYILFITTADGSTGPYTLSVSTGGTAAPPRVASRAGVPVAKHLWAGASGYRRAKSSR